MCWPSTTWHFQTFPNHPLRFCTWWLGWCFSSEMPIVQCLIQVTLLQDALMDHVNPRSSPLHWLPNRWAPHPGLGLFYLLWTDSGGRQLVYIAWAFRLSWGDGGVSRGPRQCVRPPCAHKCPPGRWPLVLSLPIFLLEFPLKGTPETHSRNHFLLKNSIVLMKTCHNPSFIVF